MDRQDRRKLKINVKRRKIRVEAERILLFKGSMLLIQLLDFSKAVKVLELPCNP